MKCDGSACRGSRPCSALRLRRRSDTEVVPVLYRTLSCQVFPDCTERISHNALASSYAMSCGRKQAFGHGLTVTITHASRIISSPGATAEFENLGQVLTSTRHNCSGPVLVL